MKTIDKLIFICVCWGSLPFQFGATVRFLPLFCIFLYMLFSKKYFSKERLILFLLSVCLFLCVVFIHGFLEAKDLFFLLFAIISSRYCVECNGFNANIIIKYVFLFCLPLGVFDYFFLNYRFNLIPDQNFQIWINGGTKHLAGYLGTILCLSTSYLFDKKCISKTSGFVLLFIGIYFVVFSTSRSYLLGLVCTFVIYLVVKRFNKKIVLLISLLIISSTFFMENIASYSSLFSRNTVVYQMSGAQNYDHHGVTSGRFWLWNYHWNTFTRSKNLMGGGRDVVDFTVGDYLIHQRETALAGSESWETSLIAEYGLIGFIIIAIQLYYLFYALRLKDNTMSFCIIFCMIYNTVLGDNCISPLARTSNVFLWMLFFKSINKNNMEYCDLIKQYVLRRKELPAV